MKPLEGVVVLDLTRFLAGPYCTLLLAGLGAEVIRVEPPGGDPYRQRSPFGGPKGASLARQTDDDIGMTVLHRWRGKKSVTLNLRDRRGVEMFLAMCRHADVVTENYLPGTLEKMGLAFPTLEAVNPRLIVCSISGFGQNGPNRDWRAFDPIVQAMSGISSVTGYPDKPPARAGAAISDTSASLYGVIGILSALRAREKTGKGDWIDVSMLDGTFFLLAEVLEYVTSGVEPVRRGNGHQGAVPFNVYQARDGWVSICAVTTEEWMHLLGAMDKTELAGDPRFEASAGNRHAHRDDIDALVGAWVAERTVGEAITLLQQHRVPAGPVRTLPEVFADEHMRAREMVVGLEHPTHGTIPGAIGAGMPIKFMRHPAAFDAPAPLLGAHNAEVYARLLGLGAADLDKLSAEGVI
jgi:crotonobetainyl-CoA:carnitine CoA-transferase CaiB-like acyl-CoA transferase